MSARLAELHRERARLGRELASVDEAIAAELSPLPQAPPSRPRARARRTVVPPRDEALERLPADVVALGEERARRALRRHGHVKG